MNHTERMQELEREHERIAKVVAEGQAQLLRIEGAILILRELVDDAKKDEQEQVPEA